MKPHIHGPKGHLVTGHLRQFYKDQLGFLTQCAREQGDVVRLRFLHVPVFLISHPDHIEYVLEARSRNFVKPKTVRLPLQRLVFGKGLLASEGDEWLLRHRQIHNSLHRDVVNHYAELVTTHTERMIATLKSRRETDIYADMKLLAVRITSGVFFGIDLESQTKSISEVLSRLTETFKSIGRPLGLFHHYLPTKLNRRFKRDVARLDEIIYEVIRQRRAGRGNQKDVLSTLLSCQQSDGTQLTERQIRDEVMTLFMAGHHTPAIALSWTFYLLTQHPEVEARLLAELDSVLGENPPSAFDVDRLKYSQAVIKESLRLYPPNRSVGREALSECEIGGHRIPARAQLIMSQWVVHRDRRFFQEPDEFRPERWTEECSKLPKYAYFPFGGGPRLCLGKSFAQVEMVMILARIIQKFKIALMPGSSVEPRPAILLQPHGGVKVLLSAR